MTIAALYVRVSTRHQAEEGFSLDDQREALTALASERGWEFRLYVDAGISGEKIDNRPGLLDLLNDAAHGEVDVVAVMDESRSGDRDLSDPSGSFVATVLGAAAALEQDLRTAKTSAGLRAAARAGFWPGGPPPFGYRLEGDPGGSRHKVLVIDEGEARVLREAVSLIVDHGLTTWTAVKTLNATGHLTRSGKPWYHANLRYQLQRHHMAGSFTYRHASGPVTIEIPQIVTEARWEALQAALRATSPTERAVNRFYPLTGHTRCACGGTISGTYRADRKQRFYKCSQTSSKLDPDDRCPHYPRNLPAERIEEQVWEAIYRLLTDPDRLREAAQRSITAATQAQPQQRTQRASLSRRLDELDIEESGVIRTHAREQINDTQLANALDEIADERQALRNHLAQLDLWEQRSTAHRAQLEALQQVAQDAKRNLADPAPQDQRRIYNYRSSLILTGRSISRATFPPTDSQSRRRPVGRFHKESLGTPDLPGNGVVKRRLPRASQPLSTAISTGLDVRPLHLGG